MTNQAICGILEHLCNEARNSAHATLGSGEMGAVELRTVGFGRDRTSEFRRAFAAPGQAGLDQLLRSLDDVRDLLSRAAGPPATLEEFDLERCAADIIEALNLASGTVRDHMVLESHGGPFLVTQDRKTMEQLLTRVLDVAFKLARSSGVRVRMGAQSGEDGVEPTSARLSIDVRDTELAMRLAKWLNANAGQTALDDPGAVTFALAVMVAGKHLRALGGAAELQRDASGWCAVALRLPSQARGIGGGGVPGHPAPPEALHVLVAEDNDESFTLSALLLQNERVWRARDGVEALAMIHKQRFDIVLMDIHMPGMDGYEAIRGIREWETQTGNARTPIVVLSADDLETQRRHAAQCGCSGFLRKPLRPEDLTILVDRLKQVRTPAA